MIVRDEVKPQRVPHTVIVNIGMEVSAEVTMDCVTIKADEFVVDGMGCLCSKIICCVVMLRRISDGIVKGRWSVVVGNGGGVGGFRSGGSGGRLSGRWWWSHGFNGVIVIITGRIVVFIIVIVSGRIVVFIGGGRRG